VSAALWLLFVLGVLGAFDTLYYHEWRARLPALGPGSRPELTLHASRDFIYGVLFATLPWIAWRGAWVLALGVLLAAEISITIADFVIEDRVRAPLGGVYPGERATHAVMGIVYGAMLAFLLPEMGAWWSAPTSLAISPAPIPGVLRFALSGMAAGVFLSGIRDLAAARRLPGASWPWAPRETTLG
jgi:hypothetical protein